MKTFFNGITGKKKTWMIIRTFVLMTMVIVLALGCSSEGGEPGGEDKEHTEGSTVTAGANPVDTPTVTSEADSTGSVDLTTEGTTGTAPEVTNTSDGTVPEVTKTSDEVTPEVTEMPAETTPEVTEAPIEVTPEITEAPVEKPAISAKKVKKKLSDYYDDELVKKFGVADEELFLYYAYDSGEYAEWPKYIGKKGKNGLMGKMFLDYNGDGLPELLTATSSCSKGGISVNVLVYCYDADSDTIVELTDDGIVSPRIEEANYSLQGSYKILDDGLYVYFTDVYTFDMHEGGFCCAKTSAYRLGLDGSCTNLVLDDSCDLYWRDEIETRMAGTKKYMPDVFKEFALIAEGGEIDERTPGFTPLSRCNAEYTDIFTWQLMKQKDQAEYSISTDPLYTYYMWYGENGSDPQDMESVNYPTNKRKSANGGNGGENGNIYEYGLKPNNNPPYTEYIIYDSNYKELTKADISFLTKEELRLARNEIYARYGRKFSSKDLQDYFDGCSWYVPRYDPNSFSDSWLNEIEKKNIKLIKEVEDSKQ